MRHQTLLCMLFILFASAYLSAGYWGKVVEKWLPWMPLRRALGFTVVHTILVLFLASTGSDLLAGYYIIAFYLPANALSWTSGLDHLVSNSPLLFLLLAGGLLWFLLGLLVGLTSQATNRVSRRRSAVVK